MSGSQDLRRRLLLSIQRALLGEVTPSIRALTAAIDENGIRLRWIIDGNITDGFRNNLSAAGTEVVADFEAHQITEEFLRCDAPHPMRDLYLDELAYLRKE
jgi:hypothetical protein